MKKYVYLFSEGVGTWGGASRRRKRHISRGGEAIGPTRAANL